MRVACPNCEATYEIPDAVLAGGSRRLRCARCAHEWIPPVPAPASGPPAAAPVAAPPTGAPDAVAGADDLTMPPPPAAEKRSRAEPEPDRDAADPSPAEPAPAAPAERPVRTEPPVTPPLPRERLVPDDREPQTGRVAAAWVVSVAVLTGLGGAAYLFRDAVQSAWPPSQLVYAALGLS